MAYQHNIRTVYSGSFDLCGMSSSGKFLEIVPFFFTFISVKFNLFLLVKFFNATVLAHATQKLLIMLQHDNLLFVS